MERKIVNIKTLLTDAERLERAKKAAELRRDEASIRRDLEKAKAFAKNELEAIQEQLFQLDEAVFFGHEYRDVEIEFSKGAVVRLDTDEMVPLEHLSFEDRQLVLAG